MMEVSLPLAAYRQDARHARGEALTPCDAELIRLASLLNRCAQVRVSEPDELTVEDLRVECGHLVDAVLARLSSARIRGKLPYDAGPAGRFASIRDLAVIAEEGGALHLSNAILFLADREYGREAGILERGRALAQRARVARSCGEVDSATEFYGLVREWGEEHDLDELRARADVGAAMIARERGNVPLMQSHFEAALAAATASNSVEMIAVSHHGLMLAAAAFRKFDVAVVHAWSAFRDVEGDEVREGDALLNVAQATLEYGEPAIALQAFIAALSRRLPARLELPALGGAAIAAASTGDRGMLDRIIQRIDGIVARAHPRYDGVAARAEVAQALQIVHDPRAEEVRIAVLTEATAHRFNEIMFRMEHLEEPRPAAMPVAPASPELREVLDGVQAVSNWSELHAAF